MGFMRGRGGNEGVDEDVGKERKYERYRNGPVVQCVLILLFSVLHTIPFIFIIKRLRANMYI